MESTNWLAGRVASLLPNLLPEADASATSCSTGYFCNSSGICIRSGTVYAGALMEVTVCGSHTSITDAGCC